MTNPADARTGTPESTAPIPLPLWERPEERRTYLVGGRIPFQNFCRERGVNPHSDRVRRVAEAYQLEGANPDTASVVFLRGWQDALPRQWREIYDTCIARGLADPPQYPRETP